MKMKRLLAAVMALVMVGSSLGGIIPVMADEGDPTVRNPEGPTVLSNGAKLYKTAASVPGYANMWRVTLRIETPIIETKSDTVLVIDNSNSMNVTTQGVRRIDEAVEAAKTLAEELLPTGNTTNRIAVVSFNGSVSTRIGFSSSYSDVEDAIEETSTLEAGTHTQAGMHAATELIRTSTADIKNIVLLSDGEPSYSYAFTSDALADNSNFVTYTTFGSTALQTSQDVAQSVFGSYDTRAGAGNGMRTCTNNARPCAKYYNHGNSAIAEAGYYKALNAGDLYTIAVGAGENGEAILGAMASSDEHYYKAEDGGLDDVFDKITGKIKASIESANVHDVMGEGVIVENAEHSTELDWKPRFTYDTEKKIYWAEYSYEVEANEHILDEDSTDGFHPLNKNATLTYNGNQTGAFPVPYVKPFFVNVKKEVEGQTCGEGECVFDFRIEHPSGAKATEYTVEAGKTHRIVEAFPIGNYTLTEIATNSSNPVKLENYLVSYTGNEFTINEQHDDHIDVTIKNKYETSNVLVSKKWDDGNNRDGLRRNYSDLYVAVKDGSKYVAYQALDLTGDKDYSFSNLPKNRNGAEISYTVVEARGCSGSGENITCRSDFSSDGNYNVTNVDGVITNKHKPETTKLTIKKKWDTSAGTLPSVTPGFVTVEVSNNKNTTKETVTLQKKDGDGDYAEWTGEYEGFAYENGEAITYSVKEKEIGISALNSNNTLYVYKDEALEGKWVATQSGFEITNTWTPAKTVYTGSGEFDIQKLDQDSQPLNGVTFTVGSKTYTTANNGTAKVEFVKSADEPADSYTFNVTETSAPEYYDVISGTEVLTATTKLDLTVDEENLTNTYAKTFDFAVKTPVNGYVWRDSDATLVVTDRALAKELKIEKTFEGISAKAFEEKSQIEFKVSGPSGFTEKTVGNGDKECKISGSKITCIISGTEVLLPVGRYTVTENNASITNFTYTSNPASGTVSQTVGLGGTAELKIKNTYEPVKTAGYKVKKMWDDDSNRDGKRPTELGVTLYADNKAYGESVKLTGDEWEYEWAGLPLVNEDAEIINYSAKEATISGYVPDGGKMVDGVFTITNTHTPELINEDDDDPDNDGKITVQKNFAGEGNDLARPNAIMIELHAETKNDKNEVKSWVVGQPVSISEASNWAWTFSGLYKYDNGLEIAYSVQESEIDGVAFGENESTIIVYDGDAIKGSWTKSVDNYAVTNTWEKATDTIQYNGADEFVIYKVDEDNKAMGGVTFTVAGKEQTTGSNGRITVKVPISENEKTDNISFAISEKETLDGYDLASGTATVAVSCTSEFSEANVETLVNTYIKTCNYSKNGSSNYTWNDAEKTVTVVNNRSLAKSLVIRKEISGVTAEALKNNGLKFNLTGPEDFSAQEISFDKFSEVSDGVYEYEVTGRIPTGEYKVVESGAEFDGLLTLTVTGDNNKAIEVAKDDEVEIVITNSYDKIRDVSYSVAKTWLDDDDRDGIRPEELSVTLLRNNKAYGEPVKLKGTNWEYTWNNLPRADENAVLYSYSAVEADVDGYDSNDGVWFDGVLTFTNAHNPELINEDDDDPDNDGKLTVTKVWTGEGNELARPETITVMLYGQIENDEGGLTTWTVGGPVELSLATEWKWTFERLYRYEGGKEITYVALETAIDGDGFSGDKGVLVVYDGDRIKGSWTKSESADHKVTNEWKEAIDDIKYDGAKKFSIKKVDEDGKAMEGVTFTVNGEDKKTDSDGKIEIEVPISQSEKEDELEYTISEKESLNGYDAVNGSATVAVVCASELSGVNEESLVNTYTKTCNYSGSGSDGFSWDGENMALTVVNKRSLAKSFEIQKTVTGLSAEVLTELEFVITGPEDFGENGEMTLKAIEDCTISGDKISCNVDSRIPTGNYTVKENNAEVENFTLIANGDGESQEVTKDEEVVFNIVNEYEVDKTTYIVVKMWDDMYDNDGKRPDTLTVNLLAGGKEVRSWDLSEEDLVPEEELSEDYMGYAVWMYEFEDLPVADENAVVIDYVAEEVLESDDYEQVWAGGDQYATTFVNYHEPELIKEDDDDPDNDGQLVVTKVWDDGDNAGRTRPSSIVVELLANGEVIDTAEMVPNENGVWEYVFEWLYKYYDGEEIEYTVNEVLVDNYNTSYEQDGYDYVISNTIADPCLIGGCGGTVVVKPPVKPDTGVFTGKRGGATNSNTAWMLMMMSVAFMSVLAGVKVARRKQR